MQIVQDRKSDFGEQFEIEFLDYMRTKYGGRKRRNNAANDGKDGESENRALKAWREDNYNPVATAAGNHSSLRQAEV